MPEVPACTVSGMSGTSPGAACNDEIGLKPTHWKQTRHEVH